jgi:hypothetical protein
MSSNLEAWTSSSGWFEERDPESTYPDRERRTSQIAATAAKKMMTQNRGCSNNGGPRGVVAGHVRMGGSKAQSAKVSVTRAITSV